MPKESSGFRDPHMLMCAFIIWNWILPYNRPMFTFFRPLQWDTLRSEYVVIPNKCISYSAALDAFRNMLAWGGLNPKLHSPCSGGTTEAFKVGIEPHIIDLKGQWKSITATYHYVWFSDREIVERSRLSIPYWTICIEQ